MRFVILMVLMPCWCVAAEGLSEEEALAQWQAAVSDFSQAQEALIVASVPASRFINAFNNEDVIARVEQELGITLEAATEACRVTGSALATATVTRYLATLQLVAATGDEERWLPRYMFFNQASNISVPVRRVAEIAMLWQSAKRQDLPNGFYAIALARETAMLPLLTQLLIHDGPALVGKQEWANTAASLREMSNLSQRSFPEGTRFLQLLPELEEALTTAEASVLAR